MCADCADDIVALLKQQPEPVFPSENWIPPTVEEIKELSKYGNHCKHATRICEGCYRHAVAYWMTAATKINLKQPEQPRRKVVHTSITQIKDDDVLIVETCNDGVVFSRMFATSLFSKWIKLPPIPQYDEVKE
jgi:hypothetical protein